VNQEERNRNTNRQRMTRRRREEIRRKRRQRALILYYSKVVFLVAISLFVLILLSKGVVSLIGGEEAVVAENTKETESVEQSTQSEKNEEEERLNLLVDESRQEELLEKILENEEEYPERLINLAKTKPETRQFVYNYLTNAQEVISSDSPNQITYYYEAGTIPLFQQWDERWGYYTYGDDFLALTGCGPTCLAMVYVGLTGDTSQNPYTVSQMSELNGYYVSGTGSSWDLMAKGCENLGLVAKNISLDETLINAELDAGRPVIASMGPGDFTTSGHFIVLVDYTDEGYEIRDPDNITRSRQKWTYERISSQIKNLWSFTTQ
jgi:hypothetical protein